MAARNGVILVVSLILGWIFLASPAQAACYCQNPAADNCRCTASPPGNARAEAAIGGVAVTCDTPEEAKSDDAKRAPICGSSPEVIPTCARGPGPSEAYWTCWGSSVANGASSLSPLPGPKEVKDYPITGQFTFNGSSHNAQGSVRVCADNLTCCGNMNNCYAGDIPQTPTSCPADKQNPQAIPLASICGVLGGTENPVGQSDTDGRIYFPHVKNTSSITYLLQSLYRPISLKISDLKDGIISNVIYSKLFEHQGINDNTPVIDKTTNNSSLIPGKPAPTPIFDFGSTTPQGTVNNGQCLVTNVRTNPGDDLLGKKIYADLQYNQVYEYKLLDCTKHTGASTDSNASGCCPGAAAEGCTTVTDSITGNQRTVGCKCGPVYDNLPTKGKVLVFTKSPYLEYLYQNLVIGPMAIYKRFVAQDTAKEIQDIPTKATILVGSQPGQVVVADGREQKTAEIYFPHLGSVYDYFLKNLQKLLRPKEFADSTRISLTPPGPGNILPITDVNCGICNASGLPDSLLRILESAGQAYNVPGSVLLAILSNEGGLSNYQWTETNVFDSVPNCDSSNVSSSGAKGPFQFIPATWAGHADDVKINYPNLGRATSPCYLLDSAYAAAKLLQIGHYGTAYPYTQCAGVTLNRGTPSAPSTSSCQWTQADVVTAARQYLGYCEEPSDPDGRYYSQPRPSCVAAPPTCYQAQVLADFSGWACSGTGTPIAPPNAPPISQNNPATPSDFVVAGTPSAICAQVKFGVRQQLGTTNCIKCSQGAFVSSTTCPQTLNSNICAGKNDFATIDIAEAPGETPNRCALCYADNVLNITTCNSISQAAACHTNSSCYANNQEPGQSCEPQFCPNPGNPGRFCCSGQTGSTNCDVTQGYSCTLPPDQNGKICASSQVCTTNSGAAGTCCRQP